MITPNRLASALLALLITVCFAPPLSASDAPVDAPLWLSDGPPDSGFAQRLRRSHGGMIEMARDGSTAKRLWLRSGDSPHSSGYLTAAQAAGLSFRLTTPGHELQELEPFSAEPGTGLHFAIPEEGYYNVYAVQRTLAADTLTVQVAKAELLRHLCSAGHDYPAELVAPRMLNEVPLEVIRKRLPKEDFHTHLASGDRIEFQVLHRGRPAGGATLRLVSGTDWSRTVTTDARGIASFQLIRDYYPDWQFFNRRRQDPFLAIAEYTVADSGQYQGSPYQRVRYLATLPGHYMPPTRDYHSYAYGLTLAVIACLLGALATYLYRRRRWSPPREEAFDEKA